ncbi:MAG: GntR family transcriptional regulator [Rhodococcus sp.]|nr:GntR family transcriptional regulator [Rhodococcus sp. (in: high G+C Gram-positive bacteria)]
MTKASLGEQVYLSLRDDLMTGAIPPGGRLGEEKLAEAYNVSRTPVREALARLLADGLIQRDRDGLYPYRPRLDELASLYELRITLELRGLERVREDEELTHDADILGPELDRWYALRQQQPAPDAGFVVLDEQFHTALLAASGNQALADALTNVNARVRPVRMFDYLTPDRMSATIEEHIQVAELALDRKIDEARTTLLRHISESREVVIERAQQALSLAKMAWAVRD